MGTKLTALIVLGIACVVAAGGGAYLAVRQGQQAQIAGPQATQPAGPMQSPASEGRPAALVSTPPAITEVAPPAVPAAPAPVAQAPAPRPRPETRARNRAEDDTQSRAASQKGQDPHGKPIVEPPDTAVAPPDVLNPRGSANTAPDQTNQVQANRPQPISQPAAEPEREFVDVTVPAESVLGLQVQTSVSSETARVEDRVEARVTRDVRVGDRVAIPAGSQAIGTVVQVERGGKLKDRAHFAIRFNEINLPDGTRLPITAEAVHREGPSPANKSAAKIGGAAVGGAILGAILGGGKGAAIGSTIGAAGGTAATMASDREPATLPAGSMVNIRLMSPVTVTLER